jgi:hypothetical protein
MYINKEVTFTLLMQITYISICNVGLKKYIYEVSMYIKIDVVSFCATIKLAYITKL